MGHVLGNKWEVKGARCDVAAPLSLLDAGRWTLGERREGSEMLSRGLS